MTGIPTKSMSDSDHVNVLNLKDRLSAHVVGQDAAIDELCEVIQLGSVGLRDPHRPRGAFIVSGPTGVGKTLLAKTVARELMGDEHALIQLNMSEYMEKHSVSRLVGAPPGYVGHDEGGQLTEKVRRRPYSVVLLDEIEKAHPDVINIFLQVLEEGLLTDSLGRKVNFSNTIILMSSNLGSEAVTQGVVGFKDKAEDKVDQAIEADIGRFFRVEFINRLDGVLNFHQLSHKHLFTIVGIEVRAHEKMLQGALRTPEGPPVSLVLSDAAKKAILREAKSDEFGGRGIRSAVEKYVGIPVTKAILRGKVTKGQSVAINYADGEFVVRGFTEGANRIAGSIAPSTQTSLRAG